ncbi:bifunctional diaminohydroxyphosphoribosylaminopyrimidine deaminase/5-amino-6-(5-phosphoribosylamino)uracil reductase RibD [Rubidibacter lacunae]|nr:bifunctional diaminohydroxyphosphoribosylaminopyrimidine deaminase/5-amino-6-(5-phosphoribosylamino)uracil reductase RibD [Rubidibacter lacunae]
MDERAERVSDFDRAMMRRCLELASKALGRTSPNPLVGAVVVNDGEIVGEGFHPGPGQPHAEVFALRAAGARARGATIYVNLEPCNHFGRTPPCSEAVIAAGIARVVIGMSDPNPVAAGGRDRLQAEGIEVQTDVEAAACRELNEAFAHWARHQQPFGILKYAMTLDGKIATANGHSAWVSGEAARRRVHQERLAADVVVVGGNTLRQDNPLLTTHAMGDRNPLRTVLSRTLELPPDARLWRTDVAPSLVLTAPSADPDRQAALRDRGVEVVVLEELTPTRVMEYFYERQLSRVLWECGGTLAAAAIAAGAVQKVLAFIAPKIVGGATAPSPVGDLGITSMEKALALTDLKIESFAPDWLLSGYLRPVWGMN